MINFCKYNDLFICNGRVGDDQKLGEFTFKNVSVIAGSLIFILSSLVIDYVICSSHFIRNIDNFTVIEFSQLFSDAHRPLSLCVRCDLNEHENDMDVNIADASNEPKIKKWENDKVHNFVNSLDTGKIDEIMNELDKRDIDIDGVIDEICTL